MKSFFKKCNYIARYYSGRVEMKNMGLDETMNSNTGDFCIKVLYEFLLFLGKRIDYTD